MDVQAIVAELRSERDRLSRAIAALEGTDLPKVSTKAASAANLRSAAGKKRGRLTPQGRKRLSEMMKKRWAERRRKAF